MPSLVLKINYLRLHRMTSTVNTELVLDMEIN